ncbi:hypothetical protein [Anaerocolumna sp. MB42-C2]|uniref:hypothetical protein n=1 Tax=Anaerocolumna sp. MB42-C2 TaxID=3070997 RepID=UPI0027E05E23|nr:hypothetical protein [Anaerocolumna sp. MB42-C2]WMJ87700.1 hypothetical protein RBU59_27320 [Anaerocolumna sp. MB42-C2]
MKIVEKDKNQAIMQRTAKRLLIIFLVLIFLLSFLSRAADSVTVPRVVTRNPGGGALTFTAEGTGTVISGRNKYVKVRKGLGIDKIYVKEGEKVKKKQVLLEYNKEDIKDIMKGLQREAEKLKIQIQQEDTSLIQTDSGDDKKAEFAWQQAKENLKIAEAVVNTAVKNYNWNLNKNKNKLLEEKTKEYESAKISFEEVRLENERSFTEAEEAAEDAGEVLAELENKDSRIEELLEEYGREREQEQDSLTKENKRDDTEAEEQDKGKLILTELYRMAYGGESEYEIHQEEVAVLERKLSRAREDVKRAKNIYEDTMSEEGVADSAKQAYTEAKRTAQDAAESLSAAVKKEDIIFAAAEDYFLAFHTNNAEKRSSFLESAYKGIYSASGYEKHKKEIEKAEKNLQRAKKNEQIVSDKNEVTLKAETEKLAILKEDIDRLNNGTYDFEEEISKNVTEIEEAQEKVKASETALKEASFNLKLEKLHKKNENLQREKEQENVKFKQEVLQIDLEEKQENLKYLKTLKENGGKLKSPVTGRVDKISVEAGKQAIEDGSIAVSTGDYGILVILSREQGGYITPGDKMELLPRGKKEKIEVEIQGIRFTKDEQGKEQTEVTAVLPEGNYIPGSSMAATISKSSELYDVCVPLEAIRNDTRGSYVLTTSPFNTALGEELRAVRVAVEVLDKDDTTAAVEGALSKEEDVIISSTRAIEEGDRVRLEGNQ